MTSDDERNLVKVLQATKLDWILGRNLDDVLDRLNQLFAAYERRVTAVSHCGLPATPTIAALVEENGRNPHRVRALLQALAFRCSPDMLAMLWMVQSGAAISSLRYEYERRNSSRLLITLLLPDGETEMLFESDDHWDAAILRLATLAKADDKPVIDSFSPLYISPRMAPGRWQLRVLQWVAEFKGSPAFCPSNVDRDHIAEIADAIVGAVRQGLLRPQPGTLLAQVPHDDNAARAALDELSADGATTLSVTPSGHQMLRRAHLRRQFERSSLAGLSMLRDELDRVLQDPSEDYTPDDIGELEDQRHVILELLAERAEESVRSASSKNTASGTAA